MNFPIRSWSGIGLTGMPKNCLATDPGEDSEESQG
jgi:hypothetical protein